MKYIYIPTFFSLKDKAFLNPLCIDTGLSAWGKEGGGLICGNFELFRTWWAYLCVCVGGGGGLICRLGGL